MPDDMKAWIEAGTPKENHALLNYMIGKWTCTAEMYKPEKSESQAKAENHWILDYEKRAVWSQTILAWFDRWLKDRPEWWNDLYPE